MKTEPIIRHYYTARIDILLSEHEISMACAKHANVGGVMYNLLPIR